MYSKCMHVLPTIYWVIKYTIFYWENVWENALGEMFEVMRKVEKGQEHHWWQPLPSQSFEK